MKYKKLKVTFENSLWQTFPMLSMLLLSSIITKWFSISIWGSIISILVIQQILSGLLTWGNKDFLQRELSLNFIDFKKTFSQLFIERFFIFILVLLVVFFFELINKNYFIYFTFIVFTRFINQSFDILVIKEKLFLKIVFLDCIVLLLQIIVLFYFKKEGNTSINEFLVLFWFPMLLKGIVLFYFFRSYFKKFKFEKTLVHSAFFYAMLSFTGLIHSKIDILLVSKILDIETIGKYQIIVSFLWFIQSISMFVSGPFIHNFYRLNKESQTNSSKLLNKFGLFIVPVSVFGLFIILKIFFKIQLSFSLIISSLLFSISSFIYLPWVLKINQQKLEYRVLLINLVGSLILIGLLLFTNSVFKLTLEKTIWTLTIHQIFIALMMYFTNKKYVN